MLYINDVQKLNDRKAVLSPEKMVKSFTSVKKRTLKKLRKKVK